ncbi:hypothetical protein BJ875DRAFT_481629 [Amylocarpus encephaloides]|uniref:Uncharacterized protein n=1 Tax=Amylocarpus encephaloides TaxID=45428 RepID=A0A9P8C7U8_9HELO|nr:hypothetical protein BJ875DRAFT_481629 [Amylocarpus encephaloides]
MSDFHPETVALITGAASGIGLAIANRLLSDGITNLSLLDLPSPSLSALPEALTKNFPAARILALPTDVSQERDISSAISLTVAEFHRIDLSVHAAGIGGHGMVMDETSAMEKMVAVNLMGVWLCESMVVKQMLLQEERSLTTGLPYKTRGSIVNIGSLCGLSAARPAGATYVMTKHGVVGMTKADARDYGPKGIRINCICPGWIKTGMTAGLDTSGFTDQIISRVPLARWGASEEVAYLASFLLSDKASFITGSSYTVDGGLSVTV